MLIGRTLVEDYEDPDVLAGYILAEQLRSEQQDSLQSLLSFVGTLNVFRLLTTGKLPEATLTNYAQSLLLTDPHRIDYTDLKTRFAAKGISPIPYAYAVDLTGEQTADLIDHGQTEQFKPSLQDAYWVRLTTEEVRKQREWEWEREQKIKSSTFRRNMTGLAGCLCLLIFLFSKIYLYLNPSPWVEYSCLVFRARQRVLHDESLVLVEGGSVPIRGCLVVVPNSDLHPLGHSFA